MFAQIKSAFASKINWTAFIGPLVSMLAVFGFKVPADLIPALVLAIQAAQSLITIILRTWFTTTITPSSAK